MFLSCSDITFSRLYRYRVYPIIETADIDYKADYEADYNRPIITDIFSEIVIITLKITI